MKSAPPLKVDEMLGHCGVCRIEIPNWQPIPLNKLMGVFWNTKISTRTARGIVSRRKAEDRRMIAKCCLCGPMKRRCRRRVTITITLSPRQRPPDGDALFKVVHDALVGIGQLVDDNPTWCELVPVKFERGKEKRTLIVLEDLP